MARMTLSYISVFTVLPDIGTEVAEELVKRSSQRLATDETPHYGEMSHT